MTTNLPIDDELLEETRRVGGHQTSEATVTEALREYIRRRKQQKVVQLFSRVDDEPDYDHKVQRRRS